MEAKKTKKVNIQRMQKDQDMLEEYDFSKGIIGKYSRKYKKRRK